MSSESVEVQRVTINPNTIDERETFDKIEEAMLKDADSKPLSVLNETFSDLRHTRILGLKDWQNLTIRGERPFYAWQQKNADQIVVLDKGKVVEIGNHEALTAKRGAYYM